MYAVYRIGPQVRSNETMSRIRDNNILYIMRNTRWRPLILCIGIYSSVFELFRLNVEKSKKADTAG